MAAVCEGMRSMSAQETSAFEINAVRTRHEDRGMDNEMHAGERCTSHGRPRRTNSIDRSRHRSGDIVRHRTGDSIHMGQRVDDQEQDGDRPNVAAACALSIQQAVYGMFIGRGEAWRRLGFVVLVCLAAAYFGYAMQHDFKDNVGLLTLTAIAVVLHGYKYFGDTIEAKLRSVWEAVWDKLTSVQRKCIRWGSITVVVLVLASLVAIEVWNDPIRLMSCVGVPVFILGCFFCSKAPSKVEWRVVFSSLLLQLVVAFIVLRWSTGNDAVRYIGDQAVMFLGYTTAGAGFVFGDYELHAFAFQVLSTVIFFGALTSLLYYWKILQVLICKVGGAIEVLIHATPVEAFVGAANIFLGANVAMLAVARLMEKMTLSELHCVMTSGFATVTGALFGAYTSFGIPAGHLIAASVMSAPAAILMSKLLYPETKRSVLRHTNMNTFEAPVEHSAFHAFSLGAMFTIPIVASIAANLIGFVALLGFINATLVWLGDRVGVEELSFQMICSYVFAPLPFIMGIESKDCLQVARLIGTKLFLTEIVAYYDLGVLAENRINGIYPQLTPRSEMMATYALCGFGSFSDMGICLGTIWAIVPSRKGDVARIALRSMIAGNLACFLTACIAGTVYNANSILPDTVLNSTTVAYSN